MLSRIAFTRNLRCRARRAAGSLTCPKYSEHSASSSESREPSVGAEQVAHAGISDASTDSDIVKKKQNGFRGPTMSLPGAVCSALSEIIDEEPEKKNLRGNAMLMWQHLAYGGSVQDRKESLFSSTSKMVPLCRASEAATAQFEHVYGTKVENEDNDSADNSVRPADKARNRVYLATRFPNNYVACATVIKELERRVGNLLPFSKNSALNVLDFGCGPGTATLAFQNTWSIESPTKILAVDTSQSALHSARRMFELAAVKNKSHTIETLDYLPCSNSSNQHFDISIASFVFGEPDAPLVVLDSLWAATRGVLVLIDRGTPDSVARLLDIRQKLLSKNSGARVIAPCPHSFDCPIANSKKTWCHFSHRMQQTTEFKATRHSVTNLADVRFSYMIIAKPELYVSAASNDDIAAKARVISTPMKRAGHVIMDLCMRKSSNADSDCESQSSKGSVERVVASKKLGKMVYQAARKISWGDEWSHSITTSWGSGRGMSRGM